MKSLRLRCQVVTAVLAAILFASIVAVVLDVIFLQFLSDVANGAEIDAARIDRLDTQQSMMAMAQLLLFLLCAVVFLAWFHRSQKNLQEAGLENLKYSPGWAVGGFFVPFLNFVRPYQVMQEVAGGSAFLASDGEQGTWEYQPVSPLVGWWWGFFLFANFLGNISARLMLQAEEIDAITNASWASLAADAVQIPSAIVAVLLVRHVTQLQDEALDREHAPETVDALRDRLQREVGYEGA